MTRLITASALILGIALSCLALPELGRATAATPKANVAVKKVVKKKKKHHRKHHHKHKKQKVSTQ